MAGLKGGIIDDIFVSGLSPDLANHYAQKQGIEKDLRTASWICYVTFYSEEGAKNCVEYLNKIDPKPKTDNKWTCAHIVIKGKRIPCYIRPRDQRPVLPEIVKEVQLHQATRVLLMTFKRDVRMKSTGREKGSISTWETWKENFQTEEGQKAKDAIVRYIQVFSSGPKVYHESIDILKDSETTAVVKKSTVPRIRIEEPPEKTFKVRVSLLRISAAIRVKHCLERNINFNEHCFIEYGHDPCNEIPEVSEAFGPLGEETSKGVQIAAEIRSKDTLTLNVFSGGSSIRILGTDCRHSQEEEQKEEVRSAYQDSRFQPFPASSNRHG